MKNREIIEQLHKFRKMTPSSEWRKENGVIIMKKVSEDIGESHVFARGKFTFFITLKAFLNEIPLQIAPLFVLLLVFIFGGGVIVQATHRSLPGNFLYPVKLNIEKAQLALIANETQRTELEVEFTKKRVYEIDQLIQFSEKKEENVRKVSSAASSLKSDIELVKQNVRKSDPENKNHFKIALSLASTTNELKETLNKSKDILTDDVKNTLQEAVDTAEEAGIDALIKSIETPTNATVASSTKATEENQSNVDEQKKEAALILKETLVRIYGDAKKSYGTFQETAKTNSRVRGADISAVKDIYAVILKLYEESEKSLESENYDKILENMNLIKDLTKKIEEITAHYTGVQGQTNQNGEASANVPVLTTEEISADIK